MAELGNSQRHFNKATYVPLTVPPQVQAPARALEKLAFLRALRPNPAELAALPGGAPPLAHTLAAGGPGSTLEHAASAAAIPAADLLAYGKALARLRRGNAGSSAEADQFASLTEQIVQVQEAAPTEPVGLLHLERLEMTPVGVEHGELVHSVPLTPKESVNITHREWSVTTQTFESLVHDSLEGFSETGVTEKTDLAQSTDTQNSHSSALDVNGSVSATVNGTAYSVTASTAVSSQQTDEAKSAVKNSVAHSVAITRQASTRTRKEHQISFRVSSVVGAENLSVRVLTNPSDKDAMRVDYYQLLRKWRVDLIRYGLRMTYDLVIPNPGIELMDQVLELQRLEEQLSTASFSFTLTPDQISRSSYKTLGVQYGVALEPPPDDVTPTIPISVQLQHQTGSEDIFSSFEIEVPDGYALNWGWVQGWVSNTGGNKVQLKIFDVAAQGSDSSKTTGIIDLPTQEGLNGYRGKIAVQYVYTNIDSGLIIGNYRGGVTNAFMTAWQLKCWGALREAAQSAFDRQQTMARDRKAFLEEKIGQFDALTLRKMEREEIMKWTLQWLLGPKFSPTGLPLPGIPLMQQNMAALYEKEEKSEGADEESPDLEDLPEVSTLSAKEVQAVLGDGELIKFLHNAIEWENTLFFVYAKAAKKTIRPDKGKVASPTMTVVAATQPFSIVAWMENKLVGKDIQKDWGLFLVTGDRAPSNEHLATLSENVKKMRKDNGATVAFTQAGPETSGPPKQALTSDKRINDEFRAWQIGHLG